MSAANFSGLATSEHPEIICFEEQVDIAFQQSICSIIIPLKPGARSGFSIQSSRINVILIWIRYSVIRPPSSIRTS